MSDIRIRIDEKRFDDEGPIVIQGLDLTVAQHEVIAVLGPSGCGKTTLLRLIAALDEQFDGSIHLDTTSRPGFMFCLLYTSDAADE